MTPTLASLMLDGQPMAAFRQLLADHLGHILIDAAVNRHVLEVFDASSPQATTRRAQT